MIYFIDHKLAIKIIHESVRPCLLLTTYALIMIAVLTLSCIALFIRTIRIGLTDHQSANSLGKEEALFQ